MPALLRLLHSVSKPPSRWVWSARVRDAARRFSNIVVVLSSWVHAVGENNQLEFGCGPTADVRLFRTPLARSRWYHLPGPASLGHTPRGGVTLLTGLRRVMNLPSFPPLRG